eukprot:GHVP01012504.1.p1 GENE.GHVP01012504.1~~GHVP01012504.1.p1  ORF type:complete len:534 (-),score=51.79 GHVP01012504.1:925-2526(-)
MSNVFRFLQTTALPPIESCDHRVKDPIPAVSTSTVIFSLSVAIAVFLVICFTVLKNHPFVGSEEKQYSRSAEICSPTSFPSAHKSTGQAALSLAYAGAILGPNVLLYVPEISAIGGGLAAVVFSGAFFIPVIFQILVAPKIMRLQCENAASFLDFVWPRYGSVFYGLSIICTVSVIFVQLVSNYTAVGIIMKYINDSDVSVIPICVISLMSILISTTMGLPGTIFLGKFLTVASSGLFFILSVILFTKGGKAGISFQDFQKIFLEPTILSANSWAPVVISFFSFPVFSSVYVPTWQLLYCTKSSKVTKNGLLISCAIVIPFVFIVSCLGVLGEAGVANRITCILHEGGYSNFFYLSLYQLTKKTPLMFFAIMVFFMGATVTTSISSSLIALCSPALQRFERSLHWGRAFCVIVHVASLTSSIYFTGSLLKLQFICNILTSLIFPQIIFGLSSVITDVGAIIGAVVAFFSVVVMGYSYLDTTLYGPFAGFIWFGLPKPYYAFSEEVLVTVIVTPIMASFGSFVGSAAHAMWNPV